MPVDASCTDKNTEQSLLIVGIGASAGGVQALSGLFDGLVSGTGGELAFVVVTHTAPHQKTLLSEILARHTQMPVADASDGALLVADHVYVAPADSVLTLSGTRLMLSRIDTDLRPRNLIDVFFSSLALQAQDNAVGVVLSGTGADGTLGIQEIKKHGGFTIAQGHGISGPEYDGMPTSAIASGMIDVALPVERIGARLQEYSRHLLSLRAGYDKVKRSQKDGLEADIADICETLHQRIGHDFADYKKKTFLRRVQRRMAVLQMRDIAQYAAYLREDSDEARALFADLLIGVTSFFRDSGAFEVLAARIVPRLFANAGAADSVRVWVPGCATGEEVYSIAILLIEHALTLRNAPKVLVLATDIDEAALGIARAGRYPAASLEEVSAARIERFFRSDPNGYVIAKEVREICVFSTHSIIRDPPFSRIDFISCRNLLIYFNSRLQDEVLPLFHYALNPGGILLLGPAENISRFSDFFSPVEKKCRIFQKRATLSLAPRVPNWIPRSRRMPNPDLYKDSGMPKGQHLQRQVADKIREQFTPPHIVVEADGSIVHYSPHTARYLEPQVGAPNRQLLAIARKGLRLELRTALHEAAEQHRAVVRDRVEMQMEGGVRYVRLTVEPLKNGQDTLYLVVFIDLDSPAPRVAALPAAGNSGGDAVILEQELKETRDRLQGAIEEYETTLEELKAGNEELVSVNEELQSTNEELETSKEELQSTNEELHTVNNELANKVEELHRANADLRNLFDSTQIATVFLDRHMIIRSYTPAIVTVFNLIPSDRGRPLADIAHQIEEIDLRALIQQVLDQRAPLERPVRLRDQKVFHLMRILPYRTAADEIDGVLVTFVNVTAVVVAEEQQRLLVAELNHRVRNMLQLVISLANQTLPRSQDLKMFEKSFIGRMQALARAYRLLSRDGWHNVPLKDLLRTQLSPFVTERRYSAEGEDFVLTATAALALGLVFYELGTNATKYGSLSVAEGYVDVSWKLSGADGLFVLQWIERNGPPVTQPKHMGFGSELVQRQLRHELNGKLTMEFAEGGLRIYVAAPADQVILTEGTRVPSSLKEPTGNAELAGDSPVRDTGG